MALAASLSCAGAQETFKPHVLPLTEERAWTNAVKSHKTKDGATVEQVLRFAEKMRPKEFKAGAVEVGYNGATGEPDAVMIEYRIGARRLSGDLFVNLSYVVERGRGGLSMHPESGRSPKLLSREETRFSLRLMRHTRMSALTLKGTAKRADWDSLTATGPGRRIGILKINVAEGTGRDLVKDRGRRGQTAQLPNREAWPAILDALTEDGIGPDQAATERAAVWDLRKTTAAERRAAKARKTQPGVGRIQPVVAEYAEASHSA